MDLGSQSLHQQMGAPTPGHTGLHEQTPGGDSYVRTAGGHFQPASSTLFPYKHFDICRFEWKPPFQWIQNLLTLVSCDNPVETWTSVEGE